MGYDLQNSNSDTLIAKVMKQFAFKHQYQVAEYFGVTAQTLSGWVKSGIVPDKYIMEFQLDIQELKEENNFSEQIVNKKELEFNDSSNFISKNH